MKFSNKQPLAEIVRNLHIGFIQACVDNLQDGLGDLKDNWRALSDVVNMSETFVTHNGGIWKGCNFKPVTLADDDGLIEEGMRALAEYGKQFRGDEILPLSDEGAERIRDLLECYSEIIGLLPHSEVEKCRNITQTRLKQLLRGKRSEHDIVI